MSGLGMNTFRPSNSRRSDPTAELIDVSGSLAPSTRISPLSFDTGKRRIYFRGMFRFRRGRTCWETKQQPKLGNEAEDGTTHRLNESYEEEEWADWEHPHDNNLSVMLQTTTKSCPDCNDYVLPVFISADLKADASAALSDISSDFGETQIEERDELSYSIAGDYSVFSSTRDGLPSVL